MRGSDPDAAVYWMARMLEGGEDPRFIARRLVIAASEDVGNADPMALVVANSAAQATEMVGMPECRIILSQAVIYVALAPKSNASYKAVEGALSDVRERRVSLCRRIRATQVTGVPSDWATGRDTNTPTTRPGAGSIRITLASIASTISPSIADSRLSCGVGLRNSVRAKRVLATIRLRPATRAKAAP